ncbi:hypothetical protein K466DRAFT_462268, partial [Polyporus arcularius HHB13444]
ADTRQVCRFDYPFECRAIAGMGLDSKGRVRFEPRRNDPLVNPHNRAAIMAWRANIDMKPVLSEQAALSYIAKYASKAESNAPQFPALLASIAEQADTAATAQSMCQKLLNKMLGERAYSAQETAHLLLGIPLVRTSVQFQTLNLSKDGSLRPIGRGDEDGEPQADNEQGYHRYMQRSDELDRFSVQELFQTYRWRAGEWRKRRASTTVVLRVFPRFSPNPEDDNYEQYCRIKILLHHRFRTTEELCSGVGDEQRTWRDAYGTCTEDGHSHSRDTLRSWQQESQAADDSDDNEDEEIDPDLAELDEADWQVYMALFPNAALPVYDHGDLGRRPLD